MIGPQGARPVPQDYLQASWVGRWGSGVLNFGCGIQGLVVWSVLGSGFRSVALCL